MPKMSRGSFDQSLWPQAFLVRALKPAVCLHGPLLLGRSSLPFASRHMPKMFRGSFHPALRPLPSVVKRLQACCLPAVRPLPSVVKGVQACRLPALKPLKPPKPQKMLRGPLLLGRSSLPSASRQMPKMSRGSFDQAVWQQAFLVRALKRAVCLHGPLLLGRSRVPFASRQATALCC